MGITKREQKVSDSVVKQTLKQKLMPLMRDLGMTAQQQIEVGRILVELADVMEQGIPSLWDEAWTSFVLRYPYIAPIVMEAVQDTVDLVEAER
jgi:hypothetical protein